MHQACPLPSSSSSHSTPTAVALLASSLLAQHTGLLSSSRPFLVLSPTGPQGVLFPRVSLHWSAPHAMTPCAILKLCHVVGQPHYLGAMPEAPGSPEPPIPGSLPTRRQSRLSLTPVSPASLRGPAASSPALQRPQGGGCDVPSVHLSGRRPRPSDTCLTCLTRAMPVASPPCGLCVGWGWGPGLAPFGWTAGAWS